MKYLERNPKQLRRIPPTLNFHEFDKLLFLSISVSNNKIRTRDLIIISNSSRSYRQATKKSSRLYNLFHDRATKSPEATYRSLFRKHIYRWVRKKKKKRKTRKSNRCRVATPPRSVSGCILSRSNVIFYLVEIERQEDQTHKLRQVENAMVTSKRIHFVAEGTMPYPHRKSTVRFCGDKGPPVRSFPLRPRFYRDSTVDGQERAGSRSGEKETGEGAWRAKVAAKFQRC